MKDMEENDSEIQETVGQALMPLMMKLAKENGIEVNCNTAFSEPIPLEDWMLKKPETNTIPYNGSLTGTEI